MRYDNFRYKIGGRFCRECLEKRYGIRLNTRDCLYYRYPFVCQNCGAVRNIVVELTLTGRFKLLFH